MLTISQPVWLLTLSELIFTLVTVLGDEIPTGSDVLNVEPIEVGEAKFLELELRSLYQFKLRSLPFWKSYAPST